MAPRHRPLMDRLLERSSPEPNTGCWLWLGPVRPDGYGTIGRGGRNGGMVPAHRASYEVHFGPPPKELCVCHRCDVKTCINPAHLWLGTKKDNTQDMMRKGRWRRGNR